MNNKLPVMRDEQLVVQETAVETLVYDLRTEKACCLNPTASFVWKHCNGHNDPQMIARLMEKDAKSVVPVELVWLALDQLREENLLQENLPQENLNVESSRTGLSRREVIRRAALATALALPIVATLSFPKASLAATCSASLAGLCVSDGSNGCPNGNGVLFYQCLANGTCAGPFNNSSCI